MLFRAGWGAAAALCLVLNKLLGLPLYFTFIFLGIWILLSAAVTVMLMLGRGSVENRKDLKLPPYRFGGKKESEEKKE